MTGDPHPSFWEAFDDDVRRILVQALRRAYATACDKHDPASGDNEYTFGYTLFHYAVHELTKAGERTGAFDTNCRNLLFTLSVRGYELACYRVGQSESDPIWTSFPNNDRGVRRLVPTPYLPGLEPSVSELRKVVLAHLGNADDGLGAAYLCFPIRCTKRGIEEWAYAERIDAAADAEVHEADLGPIHPEEAVPDVEVRPKRDRKRNAGA